MIILILFGKFIDAENVRPCLQARRMSHVEVCFVTMWKVRLRVTFLSPI